MINNDSPTTTAIRAALARRAADTAPIIMPDRPADRSRNGRRNPRSVSHRSYR